ncbi:MULTISPECIES: hypothetical protein [unclassified Methylobacterium]|uniref:AbiU2 domain-containing protein n=1 Tax=unclassified Methylobacterium TaxID=2615210 RepID=UPI0003666C07|nr:MULTISPECIES: hypothetical protein [unclassified Methylobacterium]SEG42336.1 hypothetical protein SAMN04488144_1174 [Methylobacterium sp. 190mf]
MDPNSLSQELSNLYHYIMVDLDFAISVINYSSRDTTSDESFDVSQWPVLGLIRESFEYLTIIKMAKILTTAKNEHNLDAVLGFIENNHHQIEWEIPVDPKRSHEDRKFFRDDPTIKKVRKLRNKYYAHSDRSYVKHPSLPLEKNPISVKELKYIYERMRDTVEYYRTALGCSGGIFPSGGLAALSLARISAILHEAVCRQNIVGVRSHFEKAATDWSRRSDGRAIAELYDVYLQHERAIRRSKDERGVAERKLVDMVATRNPADPMLQIYQELEAREAVLEKAVERRRLLMPY